MIPNYEIINTTKIVYRKNSSKLTPSIYEVIGISDAKDVAYLRAISNGIEGAVKVSELAPFWLQPSDKIRVLINHKLEKGRVIDIDYTPSERSLCAKVELFNGGCVLLLPDSSSGIIL